MIICPECGCEFDGEDWVEGCPDCGEIIIPEVSDFEE